MIWVSSFHPHPQWERREGRYESGRPATCRALGRFFRRWGLERVWLVLRTYTALACSKRPSEYTARFVKRVPLMMFRTPATSCVLPYTTSPNLVSLSAG